MPREFANWFIAGFLLAIAAWLLLSLSSQPFLLSAEQLLPALIAGLACGAISAKLFSKTYPVTSIAFLNPVKWLFFLFYLIGPFFLSLIKANFEVALTIITGKTNPGIIRLETGIKNRFGLALLANSITLTPGTLSVHQKNTALYIHCLNSNEKSINSCKFLEKWVRRIAE